MKAVELTQRVFCIMDDDTFNWLSHWKWSIGKGRHDLIYARRLCVVPQQQKQKFIYLHKIVAGISKDYHLKFRDNNPLNLQRANLLTMNLRKEPVKWWGSSSISRFDGVKWDGYHGLWKAHYYDLTIGYYVAEMEAAEAYNEKALEILGEKAILNDLTIETV